MVCVEAGSSLDQAILRASEELVIALPAIAHELRIVATEIRAGKARLQAFHDLAKRTGLDEVRAFVTVLIQTDRFGTSIAQSPQDTRGYPADQTTATGGRARGQGRGQTRVSAGVVPAAVALRRVSRPGSGKDHSCLRRLANRKHVFLQRRNRVDTTTLVLLAVTGVLVVLCAAPAEPPQSFGITEEREQ